MHFETKMELRPTSNDIIKHVPTMITFSRQSKMLTNSHLGAVSYHQEDPMVWNKCILDNTNLQTCTGYSKADILIKSNTQSVHTQLK
jgi:hypothetical protein